MINFVEPSVTKVTEVNLQKRVEAAYRICYKSEGKMTEDSYKEFLPRMIYTDRKNKHWSPLEHSRIEISCPASLRPLFEDYVAYHSYKNARGYWPLVLPELSNPDFGKPSMTVKGNFRVWMEFLTWMGWDAMDLFKKSCLCAATDGLMNEIGAYRVSYERILYVLQERLNALYPAVFKNPKEVFLPTGDPGTMKGASNDEVKMFEISPAFDYMTVHVVTTRDILQELARHRSLSFSVESTRYCNYDKRGMTFTIPRPYEWTELIPKERWQNLIWPIEPATPGDDRWNVLTQYIESCLDAEARYNRMIALGCKPQEARMVLPGSLKTEMFLTGTRNAWEAFLKLRLDEAAHPMIRILAGKINGCL